MASPAVAKVMHLHDGFCSVALFGNTHSPGTCCLSLPECKWVGLASLGPSLQNLLDHALESAGWVRQGDLTLCRILVSKFFPCRTWDV